MGIENLYGFLARLIGERIVFFVRDVKSNTLGLVLSVVKDRRFRAKDLISAAKPEEAEFGSRTSKAAIHN